VNLPWKAMGATGAQGRSPVAPWGETELANLHRRFSRFPLS